MQKNTYEKIYDVSAAFAFGGGNRQRELLEADGVEFEDGHVVMEKYQWDTPWVEY